MSETNADDLASIQQRLHQLRDQIGRVVLGQDQVLEQMIITLMCGGHALVEGVPGTAKTLAVRALAMSLSCRTKRIQFTPDMLPADVIGTEIFKPADGTYSIKKGPIFSNLVLADEINRAPAKVQSALLEAMQERQVTIGDSTYPFDELFLVLATQNPF
mgnify:CR=1 FL=1